MIQSILDSDLYKFSTSHAYQTLFPEAEGTFTFNDRANTVYDEDFLSQLRLELCKLKTVRMTDDEYVWLDKGSVKYIPMSYWEWLYGFFRFDPEKIITELDSEGHLHIEVTDKMYKVTLYETPILAIVSELRNRYLGYTVNMNSTREKLIEKINFANEHGLKFSEFGMRRRFSSAVHEMVVSTLKEKCPINCVGTSDVYFAYKYGMKPQGTFPHEWIMFHAAVDGYKKANQHSLEDWQKVYHGALGIALMDTFTTKVFLSEFSLELAKLFDGVRQDSGDEIEIGNMVIERYQQHKIDPTTKTIVFSNALDFQKYERIARYFKGQIRVSAGIGTNLTCDPDIEGYKPANIVMKLSRCRMTSREPWSNCIKISDDLGKHMGDGKEFEIAKHQLGIEG